MKENEGDNYIGVSDNTRRHGVTVMEIESDDGVNLKQNIIFDSKSFGVADEFCARGASKASNKKGKNTLMLFHTDSEHVQRDKFDEGRKNV
jgi:hypothetical protein